MNKISTKMDKKQHPHPPQELPPLANIPETNPPTDPEEPLVLPPEQAPELVPDEDPYENPPMEFPVPGEGW